MNNHSQEMPMEQMPPMDMPQDMGSNMGGDFMPPMEDEMGEAPNPYDTNFDAGVEADEEQDPKKYIQQLTGKLSQSLNNYNENNGQTDVDLSKYVAGMIIKQAMKGLSQEDADDIISKVKADEDDSTAQEVNNAQAAGTAPQEMPQQNAPSQMPTEAISKMAEKKLYEISNGILDAPREEMPYQQKQNKDRASYRKKPFSSPKFEN